jgi:hypothetical protein
MRGFVPPDPETSVSEERYAVVYAPRKNRPRFPAASIEIVASAQAALTAADPAQQRFAAKVLGPSKSSEGLFIYYLVEWLADY